MNVTAVVNFEHAWVARISNNTKWIWIKGEVIKYTEILKKKERENNIKIFQSKYMPCQPKSQSK